MLPECSELQNPKISIDQFGYPILLVRSQFPGGERRKRCQILKKYAEWHSLQSLGFKECFLRFRGRWVNTIDSTEKCTGSYRKPVFGEHARIVFWSFVLISRRIPCAAICVLLAIFLLYKILPYEVHWRLIYFDTFGHGHVFAAVCSVVNRLNRRCIFLACSLTCPCKSLLLLVLRTHGYLVAKSFKVSDTHS